MLKKFRKHYRKDYKFLIIDCNMKQKRKYNLKVVIYSILALGFLTLTFLVDWIFIVGAVTLMILSQKELMKK